MKKQIINLFSQISFGHMESLTAIVKETLATEFHQSPIKKFTEAELWNIQRLAKRRIQRRFSL